MDNFLECMIKKKKTPGVILSSIFIVLGALFMTLVVTFIIFFMIPTIISILPLIVLLIFYGTFRVISSFDVEYEYIVTNGELDVDSITHKKRRKRLLTVHCKSFIKYGKVNSDEYEKEKNTKFSKIIYANAGSAAFEDYYAIFYDNGQKMMLIFNPTSKMTDIFRIYAPRVIK